MPEPVGADQKVALDAIWDLLLRNGNWPTFKQVDQSLYRTYDLDAARLLPQLPPGLLYGVDTGSIMRIAETTTIGLTAAGASATGRAQQELAMFLTVVRHAVKLERDFDPPTDRPHLHAGLTSADIAAVLGLSLPDDSALLNRLGAILYTERWGWTGLGGQGTDAWNVQISREVRRFRHVSDLAEYWELRAKHWLPEEPTPTAASSPASSAAELSFLDPDSEDGPMTEQPGRVVPVVRESALSHYRGDMDRVDVLVVAALPEEFEAARLAGLASDEAGPGVLRWEERKQDGVPPFLWGEYQVDGKTRFTVALSRPTQMGGRATGPFAASLADRLRPQALAMCGVCAGNPADTALGDVVVGEPVYEWDEGKHSGSGFEGDHRQFRLRPDWFRAAQDFVSTGLASYGAASEEEASLWVLEQLHRGQRPRSHPARDAYFPDGAAWVRCLAQLEERGLIRRESNGEVVLTDGGSSLVQRRLYDDVDGPQQLPYRVLAAPMASGSAVIADPDVWGRLKAMGMRKIAAVEMEAATLATVAYDREIAWLVAKGVMDHADTEKDDRYKKFAARASAQVIFALLERLVTQANTDVYSPRAMGTANVSRAVGPEGTHDSPARMPGPARVDVLPMLDELAAGDPQPDDSARTNGRLYLVIHPVDAAPDALAGVSTMSATRDLDAAIDRAVAARRGSSFAPDLGNGLWRRRSSGMVKENGIREDGSVREESLLVLGIRENGTVSVLCGRATDTARSAWTRIGSTADPARHRVILPALVLGLVDGALRIAAELADRYASYDGAWAIGLRLTGIRAAVAYDYVEQGDDDTVPPYDMDVYQKIATTTTPDLLRAPAIVVEQLVGALLRGLSVDRRYLLYAKSTDTE